MVVPFSELETIIMANLPVFSEAGSIHEPPEVN